ncbi:MAG: ATP-binding protein [Chloroflexi bacterium]|nr:ATP-binding protein [Chloroflexota bacterium]
MVLHTGQARMDAERLRRGLLPLPEPVARTVLVIMVGLPGTGKSHVSRRLATDVPLAVLESDYLRKQLFSSPTYAAVESERLFRAIHLLVEQLLEQGVSALLDATNLIEARREALSRTAEVHGARPIIVRVEADNKVIRQRLELRSKAPSPADYSDADWRVYQRMRSSLEPIRRSHFVVNTAKDIEPVVQKVVQEISRWQKHAST